ncbi:MAG: hypothetical protein AAB907_02330 [Patescibacteria group bacterium]
MKKINKNSNPRDLINEIYSKIDPQALSATTQKDFLRQIEDIAQNHHSKRNQSMIERLSKMDTIGVMTLEVFKNRLENSHE